MDQAVLKRAAKAVAEVASAVGAPVDAAAAAVWGACVWQWARDVGDIPARWWADAALTSCHNPARWHPWPDGALDPIADLPARVVAEAGDDPWLTWAGDLWQACSEPERLGNALVQTPPFIAQFLLEGTVVPAVLEAGPAVTVLDPACGTGHLLVPAFWALWQAHQRAGSDRQAAAAAALSQVSGADVSPMSAAVCRWRLAHAASVAAGEDIDFWDDSCDLDERVIVCDSLAEGPGSDGQPAPFGEHRGFWARGYDVVIANPPYIVGSTETRAACRPRYRSAHRKFSLAVPFTELCFLAARPGGRVGMLTANSFMKREFGKPLVEKFLPTVDLTHVIDTSGAFIPGHGTPTVILFGRNQPPQGDTVRAVMGIRGEPSKPTDPGQGVVWRSIVRAAGLPSIAALAPGADTDEKAA